MMLKELRISKGLNQAQCAKFLGMTTRNYQNYENDTKKANTARYHAIYKQLESYQSDISAASSSSTSTDFHTNVVVRAGLKAFSKRVAKYKKRDCYKKLKKFMRED